MGVVMVGEDLEAQNSQVLTQNLLVGSDGAVIMVIFRAVRSLCSFLIDACSVLENFWT
jgi:hypothetical protein